MPDDGDHQVTRGLVPVLSPDEGQPSDDGNLRDGVALCLSGGGYRAMLFHLGGIIRLNEMGHLGSLDRVSSVSGGSITAATLALAWSQLDFENGPVAGNLDELVVQPIRSMATHTIDKNSILGGLLRPGRTIGENIARAYDEHLFDGKTLEDLPADGHGPRFVINATNVQTGKLFRFSRPYQGDYTVGLWRKPTTRVADAVTASSAFPPVLSPHTITPSGTFDNATAGANSDAEFRKKFWLSDGGVYDNLGLETAWKQFRTILVSDGGGRLGADRSPKRNWVQHGIRVSEIVDGQVRALRKRQLIDGYQRTVRTGTYWGIRSGIADYQLDDPFGLPQASIDRASSVPTRLAHLDEETQRDLINWGYVIADTALRKWVYQTEAKPQSLPIS